MERRGDALQRTANRPSQSPENVPASSDRAMALDVRGSTQASKLKIVKEKPSPVASVQEGQVSEL